MSIIGEAQEINTVKSSWEILDSPVPLKSKYLLYSAEQNSRSLPPILKTTTALKSDRSNKSTELTSKAFPSDSVNFTSLESQTNPETDEQLYQTLIKDHYNVNNSTPKPSDYSGNVKTSENVPERMNSGSPHLIENIQNYSNVREEVPRTTNSRGTATYVCSQRRLHTEDIAETIATEFEHHARLSQRFGKRPPKLEEATNSPNCNNQVITEEPDNSEIWRIQNDESELSEVSETNIELQTDDQEIYTDNTSTSRILKPYSVVSENTHKSNNYSVHGNSSQISQTSNSSKMSHVNIDEKRYGHRNRNVNERGRNRHPPHKQVRQVEIRSRTDQNDRSHPRNEDQHDSQSSNVSNWSGSQSGDTHSIDRPVGDESIHSEKEEHADYEGRDEQMTTDSGRQRPDGVDHPQIQLHTAPMQGYSGQAMPTPHHPPPNYLPGPTIIQNGISQADLLELMSKGIGKFTTELIVMVIDKLKPEYETFAKQVGEEVKDSTVTELKELREKLAASEKQLEALTKERDTLKVENSKERDQIKKEFEKDRLKRVKEFEEKKELIDTLQKENEQFKGLLKEKDKSLRKADMKAKSEEQKRIKLEEETDKKLKDMQKDLDKTKGQLLVQKSKKRIQITSAQSKKECLGKLNSQHGLVPKQFNGHKPIPYDEGDD